MEIRLYIIFLSALSLPLCCCSFFFLFLSPPLPFPPPIFLSLLSPPILQLPFCLSQHQPPSLSLSHARTEPHNNMAAVRVIKKNCTNRADAMACDDSETHGEEENCGQRLGRRDLKKKGGRKEFKLPTADFNMGDRCLPSRPRLSKPA